MLSGEKCCRSCEQLCSGGFITAIAKKGRGIRPIAVLATKAGVVQLWLVRWLAASACSAHAAALLAPRQAWFWGSRVELKLAIHACRRYAENMPQGHVFCEDRLHERHFNTLRRYHAFRRLSNVICPGAASATRRLRTAATAICSSRTSRCSHRRGRSRGTRSDHSTSAWPSTICCHRCSRRLSSDTWMTSSMGAEGGSMVRRTSVGWSLAQRSSALKRSRSKCEVAGLTDTTRSILAARGVTLKEITLERPDFPRDLKYFQAEGSTPCWHPNVRIWRH